MTTPTPTTNAERPFIGPNAPPAIPSEGRDIVKDKADKGHESIIDKVDVIEEALRAVLNRTMQQRGTSFDAFYSLTGGKPTVPFNIDGDDERSKEEIKIFREMSSKYDQHTTLSRSPKGYQYFKKEWDELAGRRREQHVLDSSTIVVYAKSVKMLQDCYDKLEKRREASLEAQETATERETRLNNAFRQVARNTPAPTVAAVAPVRFPVVQNAASIPVGHPFVLSPEVSAARVGAKRNATSSAAPYSVPTKRPRIKMSKEGGAETDAGNKKPAADKLPAGLN